MANYKLHVTGMTCTDCENHVSKALRSVGAEDVRADFRRDEAVFRLEGALDRETLFAAVRAAGYHPQSVSEAGGARTAVQGSAAYDLAVIGSGGAAFSAAIRARDQGARVVMIERGTIGGTCVNIGCVPSKTLLRAGEIFYQSGHHPFAGLATRAQSVDLAAVVAQKDELVAHLRQAKYSDLIDDYGWELIHGEAAFTGPDELQVAGRRIQANAFLIATGASPAIPDIPGLADSGYLTSTTALALKQLPKRLAVIGSGYIALELGLFFRHLGVQVTLIQRSARVLKEYEPEVSEAVTAALAQQGLHFITGARYRRVERDAQGKQIHLEVNGAPLTVMADEILVAVGRRPNTEALQLEQAGVKVGERGEVLVDAFLRTSNPRIYAAGDVTLGPQFVYVAAYEGGVAAENALGGSKQVDLSVVPAVTFTNPAIATVGLTEAQAREAGHEVKTSVLPLEAVPRALVNRETTGVFKLVADVQTDRILGAHVVAENAGDVIHAAVLAVRFKLTVADLKDTLAPYLTMSEGLRLTAQTFGRDVSKLSCCAG